MISLLLSGPHRILTQENSSPKKDFYAFYQQATVGPCLIPAPPVGLSKTETSKWFVDPFYTYNVFLISPT